MLAGSKILCGTRLCHEIAHSWFGLAIGARDWTEEWISEGFATYLEDVFWAKIQQVPVPVKNPQHIQHSSAFLAVSFSDSFIILSFALICTLYAVIEEHSNAVGFARQTRLIAVALCLFRFMNTDPYSLVYGMF